MICDSNTALATSAEGTILQNPNDLSMKRCLGRLIGRAATERILDYAGKNGLRTMNAEELMSVADLSPHAARRLVAARELGNTINHFDDHRVSDPNGVLQQIPPGLAHASTEYLLAVCLTGKLKPMGTLLLSKGGMATAAVRPADVFRPILRLAVQAFVICHNHPSGDPTPSREDVFFTNRLARLAHLLGVDLLDHLVVATGGVVSFRHTDLMPTETEIEDWDRKDDGKDGAP